MTEFKILMWMNMPSHHQSAFYREIRNQGIDLIVCYYGIVDKRRRNMGWNTHIPLSNFERYFSLKYQGLESIEDWHYRIHIVPGYGNRFLRKLVVILSNAKVKWIHWSERSHPGLRWYLSYPIKFWYAQMVNHHAIGAFGCGNLAIDDFISWGIRRELLSILPYSPEHSSKVKIEKLESLKDTLKSKRVFLYIGRLEYQKGIDLLLKAFTEASKSDRARNWVLVLAGNDLSNGYYEFFTKKMSIENIVFFLGVIPASEILAVHMIADVFIFPTRYDGWGAVVSESASQGKALIVSEQCDAARHLVETGINGFVIKAGSWHSLAYAMQAYIRNPKMADYHGQESLLIYQKFSPQSNAKRFIKIVRSWLITSYNDELSP